MSSPLRTRLAPLALSTLLAACGGHGGKPAISSIPAPTGPITPDPAPEPGPAPTEVLDALATGGSADSICFAWAKDGSVMCSIDVSSIQGGATMSVRLFGPRAAELVYYRHPDDQQYLQMDTALIDHAALAKARAAAAELGLIGWSGPDVEIEPGGTVVVGNHTVRRIRTETGEDGDGVTVHFEGTVEVATGAEESVAERAPIASPTSAARTCAGPGCTSRPSVWSRPSRSWD